MKLTGPNLIVVVVAGFAIPVMGVTIKYAADRERELLSVPPSELPGLVVVFSAPG